MHELLSLRQQVFVVEQNSPYLDADQWDKIAWHLLGRDNQGRLITCARLLPPGTLHSEASFGRVLVAASTRGQGIGRQTIQHCIERCQALFPGQSIRIAAQTHLVNLYHEFGFEPMGSPYDDAGVEHQDMLLETNKIRRD